MIISDTSTASQKKSKNIYSIEDAVRFVVVNHLHTMEALRAAKYPCSKQVLSYHVNRYQDEARQKQVINIKSSDNDPTISSISSVCSLTSFSSSGSSKKMKRISRSSTMVSKMRAQVIQKKRGEDEQFGDISKRA